MSKHIGDRKTRFPRQSPTPNLSTVARAFYPVTPETTAKPAAGQRAISGGGHSIGQISIFPGQPAIAQTKATAPVSNEQSYDAKRVTAENTESPEPETGEAGQGAAPAPAPALGATSASLMAMRGGGAGSIKHSPTTQEDGSATQGISPLSPAAIPHVQRYVAMPQAKQKPGFWDGLGADLRVADDGAMAIRDGAVFTGGKQFYATPGVIGDAQVKLAAVHSPYTVEQGGGTLNGKVPGSEGRFSRAKPVTLHEVVPSDTRKLNTDPTRRGDAMTTVEACSAHGLDAMGVGTDSVQQGASRQTATIGVGNGKPDVINSGAATHATDSDIVAKNKILQAIARRERGLSDDDADLPREDAKEIYQGLSESKRSKYAKEFGINQYAHPDVGEGIEAIRAAGDGAEGSFPMHFAPVIARSGDDYTTLENYAKSAHQRTPGDTSTASSAWYFRMYGPLKKHWFKEDEDQSYYGQHAQEGSIGDRGDLMGLHNANKPKVLAKLMVGAANDQYEREADRVASEVVGMGAPSQDVPQTSALSEVPAQRVVGEESAPDMSGSFETGSGVETRISARRGGGNPLSSGARSFMEPRFGADFSGVRVHNDGESHALNRSIGARAFTTGSDIFFRSGEYAPGTSGGQHLLAHELTHVVQQTGNAQRKFAIRNDSTGEVGTVRRWGFGRWPFGKKNTEPNSNAGPAANTAPLPNTASSQQGNRPPVWKASRPTGPTFGVQMGEGRSQLTNAAAQQTSDPYNVPLPVLNSAGPYGTPIPANSAATSYKTQIPSLNPHGPYGVPTPVPNTHGPYGVPTIVGPTSQEGTGNEPQPIAHNPYEELNVSNARPSATGQQAASDPYAERNSQNTASPYTELTPPSGQNTTNATAPYAEYSPNRGNASNPSANSTNASNAFDPYDEANAQLMALHPPDATVESRAPNSATTGRANADAVRNTAEAASPYTEVTGEASTESGTESGTGSGADGSLDALAAPYGEKTIRVAQEDDDEQEDVAESSSAVSKLKKDAKKLAADGQFEAAAAKFAEIVNLAPSVKYALLAAKNYDRAGKKLQAAAWYGKVLTMPGVRSPAAAKVHKFFDRNPDLEPPGGRANQKYGDLAKMDAARYANEEQGSLIARGLYEGKLEAVKKGTLTQEALDQWVSDAKIDLDMMGLYEVEYLHNPADREQYELTGSGKLEQGKPDKQPFNTGGMYSNFSGSGWAIFTMGGSGRLYSASHLVSRFHHTSFLAGADAAGAGEIRTSSSGQLTGITNKSGHYTPGPNHLMQVLQEMRDRSINLSGVYCKVWGLSGNQPVEYPGGAQKFFDAQKAKNQVPDMPSAKVGTPKKEESAPKAKSSAKPTLSLDEEAENYFKD